MKSVVLCIAVVLGVAFATPIPLDDCPEFCPYIYLPICGSDGVEALTFANECLMKQHSCLKNSKFHMLRAGACDDEELLKDIKPVKNCGPCTREYNPVCASNGEEMMTFGNPCGLRVHNCENPMKPQFHALRAGACEDEEPMVKNVLKPNCGPCTREYKPVCASNGQEMLTFGNPCTLRVHNCENPTAPQFHALRAGECEEEEPMVKDVLKPAKKNCGFCTYEYNPVCASNGKELTTFGNPCGLRVHNCENPTEPQFFSLRSGECNEEDVKALQPAKKNCGPCTMEYNPVCASNGEELATFGNPCTLRFQNCENPTAPQFFSLRFGECNDEDLKALVKPAKKNCGPCTMEYNPVCASNGEELVTFGNPCGLRVQNCENPTAPQFFSLRFGECNDEDLKAVKAVKPAKKNCGICTLEWNPLCASNGEEVKTFANPCGLRVYNCENPTVAPFFMTRSGEC